MKKNILIIFVLSFVTFLGTCFSQQAPVDNDVNIRLHGLGLEIGVPSATGTANVSPNNTATFKFSDPFWILDLRGAEQGHYTTIQCKGLFYGNNVLTGMKIKDLSGAVLSGGLANGTQMNPSIINNNGVDITEPVLYFYRNDGQESGGVVNKYISNPTFTIFVPSGTPAGTYVGKIVYTLYDMSVSINN